MGKQAKNDKFIKNLSLTVSVAAAMGLSGAASAEQQNPFAVETMESGYMQLAMAEGKCGEGKCGEGKCGNMQRNASSGAGGAGKETAPASKGMEGKCGEGKCGNMMQTGERKSMEGKCGEGKCGNMQRDASSGAGGAGKETAPASKGMEGKCGEGKCGGMMK